MTLVRGEGDSSCFFEDRGDPLALLGKAALETPGASSLAGRATLRACSPDQPTGERA